MAVMMDVRRCFSNGGAIEILLRPETEQIPTYQFYFSFEREVVFKLDFCFSFGQLHSNMSRGAKCLGFEIFFNMALVKRKMSFMNFIEHTAVS